MNFIAAHLYIWLAAAVIGYGYLWLMIGRAIEIDHFDITRTAIAFFAGTCGAALFVFAVVVNIVSSVV